MVIWMGARITQKSINSFRGTSSPLASPTRVKKTRYSPCRFQTFDVAVIQLLHGAIFLKERFLLFRREAKLWPGFIVCFF